MVHPEMSLFPGSCNVIATMSPIAQWKIEKYRYPLTIVLRSSGPRAASRQAIQAGLGSMFVPVTKTEALYFLELIVMYLKALVG